MWRAISSLAAARCLVLAVAGALLVAAAAPSAGQDPPTAVFLEDPHAFYVAQLEHLSTYQLGLTYQVYFRGDEAVAELQTGVTDGGLPLMEERSVALLAELDPSRAVLHACVGDVCRPLATAQTIQGSLEVGAGTFVRLTVTDNRRVLRPGEDLRLTADRAWVRGATLGASPALSVALPRLGEAETMALGSHPVLRLFVAPVSEDGESGKDAGAVKFEGGINSFRRASRSGLAYAGSVATDDEIGFNSITIDGEYERNLLAGRADYLPLGLTLGAESDQSFELVNGVVGVSLSYLLPWNANFSPRDGDFIPNTGPLLTLRAEAGTRLDRDETNPVAAAAPRDFERLGYDFRWRLPVARATLLRIHHAGLWVSGSDGSGDDFHPLWDVVLETEIGNLSYYIGFQQGEAAPLFRPTEATQVGVVVQLGNQIRCVRQPGNDSHLKCEGVK